MASIEVIIREEVDLIKRDCRKAAHEIGNALRNSSAKVLRGQRSGRRYQVPGTGRVKYNKKKKTATITFRTYQASAPGEPPAVRTGTLRSSMHPFVATRGDEYVGGLRSFVKYANYLEFGTSKMAPRPFHDKTVDGALPAIDRIMRAVQRR